MSRPSIGAFLHYLLAVPRCLACRRPLGPDEALRRTPGCTVFCPQCRAEWEQEKLACCPACGLPQLDCRCMPEQLTASGALTLAHLGAYRADNAIGRLILHLKDHRDRHAADFAAAQLCHAIRTVAAAHDRVPSELCITYLPRSNAARRFHGHDQAELLARAIAARLGAGFVPCLRRTRGSRAQKAQAAEARAANVAGAFAPARPGDWQGKTVVLVDDVVTTGASLAEGTRVLLAGGAVAVICAAVGLTPYEAAQ